MTDKVVNITHIAFILGATRYHPADKFDPDMAITKGLSTEASMEILREQGYFAPITPETFRIAYARRSGEIDPVPAGFTMAYLYEAGYLDAPTKEPKAKAPRPAMAPTEKLTVVDHITFNEQVISHAGNRIQPSKTGTFTYYSVANPDGLLLRAGRFRDLKKAQEFLDDIAKSKAEAQPSTVAPESATPAVVPETADDDTDLQPQPV